MVLLGAAMGAAGGLLIGRSTVCRAGACRAKTNLVFAVIAGATFGAAVAWVVVTR